jgi:hypothetical protein
MRFNAGLLVADSMPNKSQRSGGCDLPTFVPRFMALTTSTLVLVEKRRKLNCKLCTINTMNAFRKIY